MQNKTESHIIDSLDDLIKKVFSEWTISDVETGIFISSGLDSNFLNILIHQNIDIEKFILNFSGSGENDSEYDLLKKKLGAKIKKINKISSSEDEIYNNLTKLISHIYRLITLIV